MFYAGQIENDLIQPLNVSDQIYSLVLLASSNLEDLEDLEYFLVEVNNQSADVIAGIFLPSGDIRKDYHYCLTEFGLPRATKRTLDGTIANVCFPR